MIKKLLFGILFIPSIMVCQNEMTTVLEGTQKKEFIGSSLATNENGSILIVGSPYANNSIGYVRLYKQKNGEYIPLGPKIHSETDVNMGEQVFITSDGNIAAFTSRQFVKKQWVECVHFYQIEDEILTPYAQKIMIPNKTGMPSPIALNAKGNRVSIVYNYEKIGVYEVSYGIWRMVGDFINAKAEHKLFGISIDMNDLGDVISTTNDISIKNSEPTQQFSSYEIGYDNWKIKSHSIDFTEINSLHSVCQSNKTGDKVAVAIAGVNGKGQVNFHENVGTKWIKCNESIDFECSSLYDYGMICNKDLTSIYLYSITKEGKFFNGKVLLFTQNDGKWQSQVLLQDQIKGKSLSYAFTTDQDGKTTFIGQPYYSTQDIRHAGKISILK